MIIYNVTVKVNHDIHEDWLSWMKHLHIPDVMETGLFLSYKLNRVIDSKNEGDGVTYAVQYECASMKDLHYYQVNHAKRLQAEHSAKYEGNYVAFRTLLEIVEQGTYSSEEV